MADLSLPFASSPRISMGIPGLDDILGGGLTPNRVYLVEGTPGTGKTTLSLQFLLEGARGRAGPLHHPVRDGRGAARGRRDAWLVARRRSRSSNWSTRRASTPTASSRSCIRPRSSWARPRASVMAQVEELRPLRVVFDSLSEMRLLAQNPLRYRRQILALKQFFSSRDCTVLMLDDRTSERQRPAAAQHRPRRHHAGAGAAGLRRGTAAAARGQDARHQVPRRLPRLHARDRRHLRVFPRLVAAEHHRGFESELVVHRQWRRWTRCWAAA